MPPHLGATEREQGPTIVLLHGFTHTAQSWGPFASRLAEHHQVVALDLPGHGSAADVTTDLWGAADRVLDQVGDQPFVALGYSMGGRVALHLALRQPPRLRGLVLIGATAGIEDDAERADRLEADTWRAGRLEAELDLDEFLAEWLAGPLFANLSPEQSQLAARQQNRPAGLAASLRLMGTGAQTPLWDRLAEISVPTLVLVGSHDVKFTRIGRRLKQGIPRSRLVTIGRSGHACHLEHPRSTALAVEAFLASLTDDLRPVPPRGAVRG